MQSIRKLCKSRCKSFTYGEVSLDDIQVTREPRAVQPRSASISTPSRGSLRSEHTTDDTSSISARSDASVDSLVFEANFADCAVELVGQDSAPGYNMQCDSDYSIKHQEFPSLPPPNVTEGTPFSPVYRAANRSGEPLTTASADTNPVLHATIQHHRETTSDVTEEAPISPGYTAANCSGEPLTTAHVDNMHPVLHAMTQHDRATTCDVREETKSRDYTEVANRRESPTTVRAGSTEELPRETRRPEEAVTSDITGETYGSGDQTAANGRGRFPPMAREDRVPVPHTTRKGKDSDDALRRECTSRAGRQTVRTRAGSRSTSAGRGLQQAGIDSYMRGQPANLNAPTNRRTPRVKSNVDR
ncbi:hypothetical protein ACOMHN_058366 [Nucella lapillus]